MTRPSASASASSTWRFYLDGDVFEVPKSSERGAGGFVHPGGKKWLERYQDRDISHLFTSSTAASSDKVQSPQRRAVVHRHSEAARHLLQRFATHGRLLGEDEKPSSSSSLEDHRQKQQQQKLNSKREVKRERGREREGEGERRESFGIVNSQAEIEYNSIQVAIDRGEPLLFQVGKLKDKYQDWVHRPEHGKPRFFQSEICENLSKTNWYIIPLVWVPVVIFLSRLSHQRCEGSASCYSALWFCFIFGTLFWSLVEYSVHRFIFHVKTSSYWFNTLHFLFHGCHHKFPMDDMRLVMPPLGALPIVLMVYGVEYLMFGRELAPITLSGTLTGYMCYDMLHYHCHFSEFTNKFDWLRKIRSSHMDHHYRDSESGFGISTPLWDLIMQTHRLGPQVKKRKEKT